MNHKEQQGGHHREGAHRDRAEHRKVVHDKHLDNARRIVRERAAAQQQRRARGGDHVGL